MRAYSDHWPFLAVGSVFLLAITLLEAQVRHATGGLLVYALDDPYIALCIGRSFGTTGVWGLTPAAFSSSSSSPGWTLLLSGAARLGVPLEPVPFTAAVVAAVLTLFIVDRILRAEGASTRRRAVLLGAYAAATPLIPLTFTGLEHTAHIAASTALLWTLARVLSDRRESARAVALLCGLAAAATAFRFETLFIVAPGAAILIWQRRVRLAVALTGAAAAPILAIGCADLLHGWWFLPASIQLKGNDPLTDFRAFLIRAIYQARGLKALLALDAIVALQLAAGRTETTRAKWLGVLVIAASILHICFGAIGWFYRYEAYMLALAMLATGVVWKPFDAKMPALPRVVAVACGVVAIGLLAVRTIESNGGVLAATEGIYRQQYQAGRFLRRWYSGQRVVLNDIGAMTFVGEIEPVDLAGLANIDVARARRSQTFDTAFIRRVAARAGARVAIVYEEWYAGAGGLPPEWTRVRRWSTRCTVCGGDTISFFAIPSDEAPALDRHLSQFEAELPSGIFVLK